MTGNHNEIHSLMQAEHLPAPGKDRFPPIAGLQTDPLPTADSVVS